jgi:HSP20 family protein
MFSLTPWRKEKGTVARRNVDPFTLMRREFDNMFDHFFGRWPMGFAEEWERPAWGLDLVEEDKHVVARAEAPGFEAVDFDVRVTGDMLTIVAEHKEAEKKDEKGGTEKGGNGRHSFARMERTVTLPPFVDPDKVEAVYRNGVLELRFPMKPEAEGKKIEVKA